MNQDQSFQDSGNKMITSIIGGQSGATSTAAGESLASNKNSLRPKKSQRLRDPTSSNERKFSQQEGLNISRIGGLAGMPGMVNISGKRPTGENGEPEGASVLTGMDEAALT